MTLLQLNPYLLAHAIHQRLQEDDCPRPRNVGTNPWLISLRYRISGQVVRVLRMVKVAYVFGQTTINRQEVDAPSMAMSINAQASGSILIGKEIFITPWFRNGNILDYLQSTSAADMSPTITRVVHQLSSGLAFLHSQEIVHGNLYHGNIMIKDNGDVVITDIGDYVALSTFRVLCSAATMPIAPSSLYKSPEELHFSQEHEVFQPSKAADVHSFAGCIYSVYQCKGILEEESPNWYRRSRLLIRISENGVRCLLSKPASMPCSIWSVLITCWDMNPHARPTMDEVYVRIEGAQAVTL
ncbi:hypothetical protein AMATHDRAFT_51438 [Amanita thiersii Skay4041]|uniref:Protein kinase domain-containing protein n=1 Tax=Amanita thiersii Skay4041 TaxID=703135 RepID=A0A2A9NDX3_9AGAR|nr:hypothetical protein AMATHDRAFT_51438 [Amanita thiersii Skay4041]